MRALLSLVILALAFATPPAIGQRSDEIWTARIFDTFSQDRYTWRLKPDGSYTEEGHDIQTGVAIQEPISGVWRKSKSRLVLRQDSFGFVFDGTVNGEQYSGTLFQYGQKVSAFCAWRGREIPASCDSDLVG
jgi:hypothetical protein